MHLFHIPQCSIQNRNLHISVLNGALCDMEQVHSGICEIRLFNEKCTFASAKTQLKNNTGVEINTPGLHCCLEPDIETTFLGVVSVARGANVCQWILWVLFPHSAWLLIYVRFPMPDMKNVCVSELGRSLAQANAVRYQAITSIGAELSLIRHHRN